MASIRKRGGKWQVRWREPGDGVDLVERGDSFTRKKDADALLAIVSRCEELGTVYVALVERGDVRLPAIGEGVSAFVADLRTSHDATTIARYRSAFALFSRFLDDTGDGIATIERLSREMLTRFYDWLGSGRHGKARALNTKRRIVAKVQAAWEWLDENEWNAAVPRSRSIKMRRDPRKAVYAPTFDEMAACVRACASEGPRRLTTTLYFTGLRAEQAHTALWEHVDLERATMFVPPHKGLPGRIIPLSPHFVAELATWGKREGRLCGWYVVPTVVRHRLNEAWARAGVREAAWKRAPNQAFRRGVTTGLKLLGIEKEDAELYVGRVVEGARAAYLAVDMLPLHHVAAAFPKIEAPMVVPMKKEGRK